jgi:hypothetical protein
MNIIRTLIDAIGRKHRSFLDSLLPTFRSKSLPSTFVGADAEVAQQPHETQPGVGGSGRSVLPNCTTSDSFAHSQAGVSDRGTHEFDPRAMLHASRHLDGASLDAVARLIQREEFESVTNGLTENELLVLSELFSDAAGPDADARLPSYLLGMSIPATRERLSRVAAAVLSGHEDGGLIRVVYAEWFCALSFMCEAKASLPCRGELTVYLSTKG